MARMKDSLIEWIGVIPEHWKITKLKYIAKIYNGNSISDDKKDNFINEENSLPYISTKDIDADTNKINYANGLFIPKSNLDFRIANEGTILLCIEGGSAGRKIAFTDKKVCFVNKLCCFDTYNTFESKLLYYICQCDAFLTEFNLNMGGLIGGVSGKQLKNMLTVMPPVAEQKIIINYLEDKCKEIDKAIADQRNLIEKLILYRISLITEKVCRGLVASVPMKNSRAQWLGNIPKHWDVKKLKYIFNIKKDIAGQEGFDILSVTLNGIKIKDISKNEGQIAQDYSKYQLVDVDDFIMNHMDLLTGFVDCSKYKGVTSPDYRVFKPITNDAYKQYYNYVFQQCYKNKIFYGLGQGVSGLGRWRLPSDMFLNFLLPMPPFSEQRAIAEYLDKHCKEIDNSINKKEEIIVKLEEYKKSLIYECVTGKKEIA